MALVATGSISRMQMLIDEERRSFARTLERVMPESPTLAGAWTAHDLAVHVASNDGWLRVPAFAGRWLIAHGVRLRQPQRAADKVIEHRRRRGYDWAIEQLRRPSPALLARPSVATITLFEVWTHHEDVRRVNGIERERHPDLSGVIEWLRRYGRFNEADIPEGPQEEVAYWLAGRDGGPRRV